MSTNKGFGLIETIVAVSIMIIIAATGAVTVLHSFSANRLGDEETEATLYAQEGVEAVRSIANQSWDNLGTGSGTCAGNIARGVDSSGGSWLWTTSPQESGKFSRTATISNVCRDESGNISDSGTVYDENVKKVTSTAGWDFTPTRSNAVSLITYLTNWMAAITGGRGMQIAYYDLSNGDLKYASCDANCTITSNWTTVIVDSSGNVGQYTSLSFDGDKPRIAYYDFTNKDLKYASCDTNCTTASNWIKIAVDSTGDVGQDASLVVDSGKPRIAYRDFTNKDLKYASCDANCTTASNWIIIAIDTVDDMGQYASLALDSGKPRIAYFDFTDKNLKYTSCEVNCTTASNWTKVSIDLTGTVGEYASLVLDSGKPRIAYYDGTNKQLKYATCDASCTSVTNWTFTIVDTLNDVGEYASLVLDSGKPRIAYYDGTGKTLKYASCNTNCTLVASWTALTVDATQDRGKYSSIALDAGNLRVSYYDATNKDLRYSACDTACTTESNWIKTVIDSAGDVGKFNSM